MISTYKSDLMVFRCEKNLFGPGRVEEIHTSIASGGLFHKLNACVPNALQTNEFNPFVSCITSQNAYQSQPQNAGIFRG
ncbi:hypothetical protein GcM1_236017 [Golovinomyces cichoracearum]|uniref:Uncharacterized protein n=1 Tax=Golovinomyces cichoracearum TaxID=62708 RepID=A0A420IKA5_9PEZI|nr:hypothetical protein GcM1_236017 [Golovinomyces cichoracearum]